jgi:hypothetical protein
MTLPGQIGVPWQPWTYRDESMLSSAYDLTGYGISATDGEIGKVDEATYETDASYLVVNTGPWIFGRTVMLPAGVVATIDHENKLVVVNVTREQVQHAPDYDPSIAKDTNYRDQLGAYYGVTQGQTPG